MHAMYLHVATAVARYVCMCVHAPCAMVAAARAHRGHQTCSDSSAAAARGGGARAAGRRRAAPAFGDGY
eukprot:COSAG01_NODE_5495_length_4226_cov_3.635328_3_plen_68_part_01